MTRRSGGDSPAWTWFRGHRLSPGREFPVRAHPPARIVHAPGLVWALSAGVRSGAEHFRPPHQVLPAPRAFLDLGSLRFRPGRRGAPSPLASPKLTEAEKGSEGRGRGCASRGPQPCWCLTVHRAGRTGRRAGATRCRLCVTRYGFLHSSLSERGIAPPGPHAALPAGWGPGDSRLWDPPDHIWVSPDPTHSASPWAKPKDRE